MTAIDLAARLRALPLILAILAVAALAGSVDRAEAAKRPVPMIFVHGQSGSVQQFETDTMRFASNGFPHKRIFAYEYDTTIGDNVAAIDNLDGFIADVKDQTGARKVDVLAHSRGTSIMHSYLSTPERAASVRRYVNFDGATASSPPGGVPTLAIWGEGDQSREIVGAENVYFHRKAHTEVTTSRAAFAQVYRFLIGKAPKHKGVVPEKPTKVKVAGRASLFPQNAGIDGATFTAYLLNAGTGARKSNQPIYTTTLGADGDFGPFKVNGRKHYEFEVSEEGERTLHNYPEPFERDDYFYRVLNAPLLTPFIDNGPDQSVVAVTRMREWWGDQPGLASTDRLELNGQNVITPGVAPRSRRVLAVFNFDRGSDGVSDTSTALSPFNALAFLTGVDLFMPASADHSGTISVKETMRGQRHKPHQVTTNVPNWPSDTDTASVFFRDYPAQAYRRSSRG
jgi:AF_1763-like, C-terminal domain/Lipase C-terminal domain/Lipase (class 2)